MKINFNNEDFDEDEYRASLIPELADMEFPTFTKLFTNELLVFDEMALTAEECETGILFVRSSSDIEIHAALEYSVCSLNPVGPNFVDPRDNNRAAIIYAAQQEGRDFLISALLVTVGFPISPDIVRNAWLKAN